MTSTDGNPVGALYEHYQNAGSRMPVFHLSMVDWNVHAPVFSAQLTVAEGHVVTAAASSKKMAKNLAAIEMLQKLTISGSKSVDEVKKKKKKKKKKGEDGAKGQGGGGGQQEGDGSRGQMLERLVGEGVSSLRAEERTQFLKDLLAEQRLSLVIVEVGRSDDQVQWLAQVSEPMGSTTVTVSIGIGREEEEAKSKAAGTILKYFQMLYSSVPIACRT